MGRLWGARPKGTDEGERRAKGAQKERERAGQKERERDAAPLVCLHARHRLGDLVRAHDHP